MADGEAGSPAGETAIGDQRTGFAEAHRFQEAGWVEHFLHPRTAFRAFIANYYHISGDNFAAENRFYRIVLAFVHFRRAGEFEDAVIDARGFNDAAVFCEITVEHRQAAVFAVGVFQRADTAIGAIVVQRIPTAILRECLCGTNACRTCAEHIFYRVILGQHNVVLFQRLRQRQAKYVFHITVQYPRAIQFAENTDNTTSTMNIFHMVFLGARRNFTQLRNLAGKFIDITHGEVDFRFLRRRQQVKYGVSRSTHRDIQRHGVFKRRLTGDITRQCTFVVLLVITFGQFNNAFTSIKEQLLTVGVGCQQRAVARLRQAQRFGQAVH